jgi:dienelactone hydrolase
MQVERPNYRPAAAVDAWQRIWDFFGKYLAA